MIQMIIGNDSEAGQRLKIQGSILFSPVSKDWGWKASRFLIMSNLKLLYGKNAALKSDSLNLGRTIWRKLGLFDSGLHC